MAEFTFKQETIHKLMNLHKKDPKTKVSADALKLSVELLRCFVEEGAMRALLIAQSEGSTKVTMEHFEKILPQLLLDF